MYQQLYADQQHDFRALSIPLQMNWPSVPLDYRPRSSHTGFSARQLNITLHEYSKATSYDAFLQLIHGKFNIAYDNTVIHWATTFSKKQSYGSKHKHNLNTTPKRTQCRCLVWFLINQLINGMCNASASVMAVCWITARFLHVMYTVCSENHL